MIVGMHIRAGEGAFLFDHRWLLTEEQQGVGGDGGDTRSGGGGEVGRGDGLDGDGDDGPPAMLRFCQGDASSVYRVCTACIEV